MILVDTSVWIDHLHRGDAQRVERLNAGQVPAHPFVIGERALGGLRGRPALLHDLSRSSSATVSSHEEMMTLAERHRLFSQGLSYVDVHLLAATRLTPEAALWTRDRRLAQTAARLGLGARMTH
jgi:predicted nucleic acid-binding protein